MIRYQRSKNAKILFIGINPHPGSYQRGVPFSNNKTFWYLLNKAGLINERTENLKDDKKLKVIYDKKFMRTYGLNLLNLIDRPTKVATLIKRGEEEKNRKIILDTIKHLRPKVVCFIGKVTYQTFSGTKNVELGEQNSIHGVRTFVLSFPIRGPAKIRIKELRRVKGLAERLLSGMSRGKAL